jgi:hypothetical protein
MDGGRFKGLGMKWIVMTFALLGWSGAAVAGEIFGTITGGGRALANAQVEVEQGGRRFSASTDARGSYRLVLPASGKATLTVKSAAGAPSIEVFSSERSLRYDLTVVAGELRRR